MRLIRLNSVPFTLLTLLGSALLGCSGSSNTGSSTPPPPVSIATTTTLKSSANPAPPNTAVTLTATVAATTGTPTGSVAFASGATSLGTAMLTSGTASLTVSTFTPGTSYNITASYGGASGFSASTSSALNLTIQPVQTGPPITANGTIDLTAAHQAIAGFGGAEAFYASYLDQHPNRAQIYTALFDPAKGLGLTFLRVQNSYYLYNGTNASSFDTDTPAIVQAANQTAGTPLQILMSSWTPPASIKSNNDVNNGGTLNTVNGGYNYAGFAQFWHDSLAAYAALGVTPNLISIQNEPDYTASYVSCRFNPTEAAFNGQSYAGYDKAFDAVYQAIQSLPNPPKMIGPESFSTTNAVAYATALEGETPQSNEIYALAHHLYNLSSTDPNPDDGSTALQALQSQFPQPLKFETEYYDAPGFNTAWNIHNAFTLGNDNAYFYWGLAWPSTITNGQAGDQAGLLYIDNPFASTTTWAFPQGWSYNDAYYAFKHFSFYVRPGYVRYGASIDNANERISAYESPDKKTLVIVVLNTSATATDNFALNSGGFTYSNSTVIRSTFSTPIATGERWNNLGSLPAAGLSLPPQSVATVILQQ